MVLSEESGWITQIFRVRKNRYRRKYAKSRSKKGNKDQVWACVQIATVRYLKMHLIAPVVDVDFKKSQVAFSE
jgi:hypothetical protein